MKVDLRSALVVVVVIAYVVVSVLALISMYGPSAAA